MSYIECHNLASDGLFLARLAAALTKGAADVIKEDAATVEHAKRLDLATRVFNAPNTYAQRIALGVATEFAGVQPTDAQLDTLIATYWTPLAIGPQV